MSAHVNKDWSFRFRGALLAGDPGAHFVDEVGVVTVDWVLIVEGTPADKPPTRRQSPRHSYLAMCSVS